MFKRLSKWTVILWILGWGIAYFVIHPPINPMSLAFWFFFGPAIIIPILLLAQIGSFKGGFKKGKAMWPTIVAIILVVAIVGGMVVVSPIFNAKGYSSRITITDSDFETDIKPVDFNNLPLLDKESSQKVGDRVVGQIPDLVSQFSISNEYSLINYQGSIIRVTPLEHNGFMKYFSNLSGTAGYVMVDETTGDAQVIRTSGGLKYLPSAYFLHNLNRHVQLHYPFSILGDESFELDESGNPYWVIQTLSYSWVNVMPKVTGVIICNVQTGECQKYSVNEVPKWVDNVFDADIVLDEVNDWGMYRGGYRNSQFAQKGVVQTTDGFTYITNDDDVLMYTGITSIASDESNIGFIMVNLRTHEADFYAIPGAEEFGAMESARGAVQEKNYTSTFPLLINLQGRPTYLLSLKDAGGLVKMYGFVDVQNFQKVSVTDAAFGIKKAAEDYLKMYYGEIPDDGDDIPEDLTTRTIEVESVSSILVEGNTVYFISATDGSKYQMNAGLDLSIVPFIQEGDKLKVTFYTIDNDLNVVTKVEYDKTEPGGGE